MAANVFDCQTMNAVKSEYDDETVKCADFVMPAPTLSLTASASKSAAMVYTKLRETDVILSLPRHHRIYYSSLVERHPGNIAYKKLVSLNRDLIASSSLSREEKSRVAQTIVVSIRQMRGRFIECRNDYQKGNDPSSHHRLQLSELDWRELDDARAIELTSNSLWECPSGELVSSPGVEARDTSAAVYAPLSGTRLENASRAANNIIDSRELINSATEVAREASSPVNVPHEIATLKSPSIAAKKAIDSNMLINLSPNQTVNLNFPVGSKVLYNVDCTSEQYSDASMGIVKSVSMDLVTRNMLYVVGHVIAPEKGNAVDSGDVDKDDAADNLFFTEEKLSIAPFSPVTIETVIRGEKQSLEGEVLSCQALHGTGNTAKKVYTVLVHIEQNKVRMFHGVSEECIRCRMVTNEKESRYQGEAIQSHRTLSKNEPGLTKRSKRLLPHVKLQNNANSTMPGAVATESPRDAIASRVARSTADDSSSVPSSDISLRSNTSSTPTSLCEIFSSGAPHLAAAIDQRQTAPPIEPTPKKPRLKKWTAPKCLNGNTSSGKGSYLTVGHSQYNDNKSKDPRSNGGHGFHPRSNSNGSNLMKTHLKKDGQSGNRDSNCDRFSLGSANNQHNKHRNFYKEDNRDSSGGGKQVIRRKYAAGRTEVKGSVHNHDSKMDGRGKVEQKSWSPKNEGVGSSSVNNHDSKMDGRGKVDQRAWSPKNEGVGSSVVGVAVVKTNNHIRFDAPVEAASKKYSRHRKT